MKSAEVMVSGSLEIIRRAMSRADGWIVAVSGGKDSTCVLDLVRRVDPSVRTVTSIQEWCLPETSEYLARIPGLIRVASGSDHGTGWAPNWKGAGDVPTGVQWIGVKGSVESSYGQDSVGGVFLGTRIDESAARKMLHRVRGLLFFSAKNNTWQCSPIAHWSVRDVWGYIRDRGLDYNKAYDRMSEIGVQLSAQRIGPLAIDKVLGLGQLAILKRGWPELFNRYAAEHPEARSYV